MTARVGSEQDEHQFAAEAGYWRRADTGSSPADLQFLLDASKSLLGYRVHVAFKQYLDVAVRNAERWHRHGLIRNLLEPAPVQTVAFDVGAIDLEALTGVLGTYLTVYAGHKGANHRLMHRFDGRQVLYLRGYEFGVTQALGEGLAAEASSVSTLRFNLSVAKLVGPDLCVFRVLSPEEAHWGIEAHRRAFIEPDIDAVTLAAMRPFRSVFLNAGAWQQGLLRLLDCSDHFLVYVSSLTPSALWELEQLDDDAFRGRVTVVFDTQAIGTKEAIMSHQARMLADGKPFVWLKAAAPDPLDPLALKAALAAKFHLVSVDDFTADLDRQRVRIAATRAPLPPGGRERSLDFPFHPALAAGPLAELHDHAGWLKARIASAIDAQAIVSPLLFLNDVQLCIHGTLLLGEHADTGRALAAYAGMLRAVLDAYQKAPGLPIWQSPFDGGQNVALLEKHIQVARDWGVSLLGCGATDWFGSLHAQATAAFLDQEGRAAAATAQALGRWHAGPPPGS